jgi:hypothetical protein
MNVLIVLKKKDTLSTTKNINLNSFKIKHEEDSCKTGLKESNKDEWPPGFMIKILKGMVRKILKINNKNNSTLNLQESLLGTNNDE